MDSHRYRLVASGLWIGCDTRWPRRGRLVAEPLAGRCLAVLNPSLEDKNLLFIKKNNARAKNSKNNQNRYIGKDKVFNV